MQRQGAAPSPQPTPSFILSVMIMVGDTPVRQLQSNTGWFTVAHGWPVIPFW